MARLLGASAIRAVDALVGREVVIVFVIDVVVVVVVVVGAVMVEGSVDGVDRVGDGNAGVTVAARASCQKGFRTASSKLSCPIKE